jgi:hypothetical protein
MTDAEKAALIVRVARAIWHATPGAQVWEMLDEDDENRALCLVEAEAAVDEMGLFSPAQVRVADLEWEDQGKGDPGAWGAGNPLNSDDWLYYARPVVGDHFDGQTLLEITVAPGECADDDDASDYWLHRPQVGYCYGSIEALKAQCQADFERRARRILSALEPAPPSTEREGE